MRQGLMKMVDDPPCSETTPLAVGAIHSWSFAEGWRDLQRRRDISSRDTSKPSRNKWLALLFGQIVALLAASQNAASYTLEYGLGKVFPFLLMLNAYMIMSLHLLFAPPATHDNAQYRIPMTSIRLRTPWWYYLCLSILDVTPNFFTLLSLKSTSLTSSTLLGSLTAPSIMISSRFLLRKTYRSAHYLGVAFCVVAGVMTVWTDILATSSSQTKQPNHHPHSYYGDSMAAMAAILYGIGDAVCEFWCKHVDRKEYLGMLGLFGTFFCGLLVVLTERHALLDLFHDEANFYPVLGVIAIYVPVLVLYYVSASVFLVSSDATLLNLSLQSCNLWAICFSAVAFEETPSPLFYWALLLEVSGVFAYELLGNKIELSDEGSFLSLSPDCHKEAADESQIC